MRVLLGQCRFQDCRHVSEPGCAIRAAVTAGTIDPDRYASYVLLLTETEEEPRDWE
jgi:ribosome biogenesis GTPase / thiamine phosphate phosphatase